MSLRLSISLLKHALLSPPPSPRLILSIHLYFSISTFSYNLFCFCSICSILYVPFCLFCSVVFHSVPFCSIYTARSIVFPIPISIRQWFRRGRFPIHRAIRTSIYIYFSPLLTTEGLGRISGAPEATLSTLTDIHNTYVLTGDNTLHKFHQISSLFIP